MGCIMKKVILDVASGTETEVEMSADEIAIANRIEIEQTKRAEEANKIAADKAALLAKLGITADEAKLLLS